MSTVTERLERMLANESSIGGIDPVPPERRRLSGLDVGVLWGDLAVGLLVLLTGALLVPSLGLPTALLAILIGSVVGCVPLALVGYAGAREGVPTMVLFRPVLGIRGSYVPSVLNVVQLVGWTGFELWTMSLVANEMSSRLFGFSSYWAWLAVVAVVSTALALGGPVVVVRHWLEKFGAWVLAAVGLWISLRLLTSVDLESLWRRPGTGGYPGSLWLAIDLVIAMPVSWLPLVADYNRFTRSERSSLAGTFVGYAIGNAWFYALGAALVLGAGLSSVTPGGVGNAIAGVAGGWVVLVALLVGETDEAFADVYSSAVSAQNVAPRTPHRVAILAVAAAGVALAAWLGHRPDTAVGSYESFLLLLGSVFVPLFGVFVAEYFVIARRSRRPAATSASPASGVRHAPVVWRAMAAWALGFVVYQWSAPTPLEAWRSAMERVFDGWLHLPFPLFDSAAGASVPAFAAAFALHLLFSLRAGPRARRRSPVRAGAAR